MVTIIRREIRQRGFFAKLIKLLFYLYNFVMAAWLAALMHVASQTTRDIQMAQATNGAAWLAGISTVCAAWAMGEGILTVLLLATRGKKIIIEESAD
jgi:hypothetical protein